MKNRVAGGHFLINNETAVGTKCRAKRIKTVDGFGNQIKKRRVQPESLLFNAGYIQLCRYAVGTRDLLKIMSNTLSERSLATAAILKTHRPYKNTLPMPCGSTHSGFLTAAGRIFL